MIPEGFPLGLRFMVSDYSITERRSCWLRTLEVLKRAGAHDVMLYDARGTGQLHPEEKHYLCVVCPKAVSNSRRFAVFFKADPRLMSMLSYTEPFAQENAVATYPDLQLIGMICKNGSVVVDEGGRAAIPEDIPYEAEVTPKKRLLVCPDAMKGSFSQLQLCGIAANAAYDKAELDLLPIGDGGEGSFEAVIGARHGRISATSFLNADLRPTSGAIGVVPGRIALIESALAVGFADTAEDSSSMTRSSYGVGELISFALRSDFQRIWVCVGGTSTTDGGAGMLCALGAVMKDKDGNAIPKERLTIEDICSVDLSGLLPLLQNAKIAIVADVTNPLLGENGAARVFGAQKGLSPKQQDIRDKSLARFASLFPNVDPNAPCMGCGGGLGFGLAVIGAAPVSGIEHILHEVRFDKHLGEADAVVTFEGSFDRQTIDSDKAVKLIALRCARAQKPLLVVAGTADEYAKDWLKANVPKAKLAVCPSMGEGGRERLTECVATEVEGLV